MTVILLHVVPCLVPIIKGRVYVQIHEYPHGPLVESLCVHVHSAALDRENLRSRSGTTLYLVVGVRRSLEVLEVLAT